MIRSNTDKNRKQSWSSKTQNYYSMTSSNDNDVDRLFCRNCGVSEFDLFEKRRDVTNRVTSFTCLYCDETEVLPLQNLLFCPVCRNDKKERFHVAYGADNQIISVACLNCQNFLDRPRKTEHKENFESDHIRAPADVRNDVRAYKRQVLSLDDISVGDHVTWHRDYVIWHHAIVTSVRSRDGKLTVVHYTGSPVRHEGRYASVREEEVEVDPGRERVFVLEYETGFSPSDVVARARSRLGEHRYNILTRNCEHFAYWCKTGIEYSGQVKSFFRRVWKTCGSALSVGLREGVANVARAVTGGLPAKRVLGVGLEEGLSRLRGGSGVAARIVGGAVLFDVFLNLALEAGIFAYAAFADRRRWKEGEISREEYYRRVCQTGCECGGGFLGATGGGFLGQLAIPIPFLGGLVGCTLGTLIGRFVGSIIGKKISDKLIDKI